MTVFHNPRFALRTDMTRDEFAAFARQGFCVMCEERKPRTIPELLDHLADHQESREVRFQDLLT